MDELLSLNELVARAPFMNADSLVNSKRGLLEGLARVSPTNLAAIYAGMLHDPNFQSSTLRLEALVHIGLAFSKGHSIPRPGLVIKQFAALQGTDVDILEDPAEDLMVENLIFAGRNYLVLTGIWEGAGFCTQRVLDVVETMPDSGLFLELKQSIEGLLKIADSSCKRAGLRRNLIGSSNSKHELLSLGALKLKELRNIVKFAASDLEELGVSKNDLERFTLPESRKPELNTSTIGDSPLNRFPIVLSGGSVSLVLPTGVTPSIRMITFDLLSQGPNKRTFENRFAAVHGAVFGQMPILGGPPLPEFHLREVGTLSIGEARMRLDEETDLHLLFLFDSLEAYKETGLAYPKEMSESEAEEFGSVLESASSSMDSGLVLIVHCGWGRGYSLSYDRPRNRLVYIDTVSAADFAAISRIQDTTPRTLIRLISAEKHIAQHGITFMNSNGLGNLLAWARHLDYHLIPHSSFESGDPNAESILLIPTDQIRALRHEAATTLDMHCVVGSNGESTLVERWNAKTGYTDDAARPTYVASSGLHNGVLTGLYESTGSNWWLTVHAPNGKRDLYYRLWEMGMVWLPRVADVLTSETKIDFPSNIYWAIKIESDFDEQQDPPSEKEITSALGFLKTSLNDDSGEITTAISKEFFRAFQAEVNVAEREIVRELMKLLIDFHSLGDVSLESLVDLVIPNQYARQFHLFAIRSYRDYFHSEISMDVPHIDKIEAASLRIGLGWRARERTLPSRIEGVKECTRFLAETVDSLFCELKEDMKQYNRRSLILEFLKAHESAENDRNRWDRTAKAVISLHEDPIETKRIIAQHQLLLNGVSITSRIGVEIALCEADEDSTSVASRAAIDRMRAKIALILQLGIQSDAIRWEGPEATIVISGAGEIMYPTFFQNQIVTPFVNTYQDLRTERQISISSESYEMPTESSDSKEKRVDARFRNAWVEEFGFTIDELRLLLDAIDDTGSSHGSSIFEVPYEDLRYALSDRTSLEIADKFLRAFCLSSRKTFDTTPSGYKPKDWYPWRYSRKLSLLAKPIVNLCDSQGRSLVVVPGMVREALALQLTKSHKGEYPTDFYSSEGMRSWLGTRNKEERIRFNTIVADQLSELGWKTKADIKLPELLNRKFEIDYGDVDTLAWSVQENRVLLIECKDLDMARGEAEISKQLYRFRGAVYPNGDNDSLMKHLNRAEIIEENRQLLGRRLGFSQAEYEVEVWLVFSDPVLLMQIEDERYRSTCASNLPKIFRISNDQ